MSHDEHDSKHFNAEKVFGGLFLFTMLEVGWGFSGHHFGWNKLMLWGGLLTFAFFKGWLIAVYFMHLKFEGWVVKSLILPTPFLIMVIMGYVMPDVANDDAPLVHPVGSKVDRSTGQVIEDLRDGWHRPEHEGAAEHPEAPAAEPAGG